MKTRTDKKLNPLYPLAFFAISSIASLLLMPADLFCKGPARLLAVYGFLCDRTVETAVFIALITILIFSLHIVIRRAVKD